MRKKHSFREPLGQDVNGLYITAAQMQFFLNRRGADKQFISGHPEFFQYFYKCAVYNIVWDMLEKYPECATIFWDEDHETVGVKFPAKGKVMKKLRERKIDCFFVEDDE